jgi:hypothetical protein
MYVCMYQMNAYITPSNHLNKRKHPQTYCHEKGRQDFGRMDERLRDRCMHEGSASGEWVRERVPFLHGAYGV